MVGQDELETLDRQAWKRSKRRCRLISLRGCTHHGILCRRFLFHRWSLHGRGDGELGRATDGKTLTKCWEGGCRGCNGRRGCRDCSGCSGWDAVDKKRSRGKMQGLVEERFYRYLRSDPQGQTRDDAIKLARLRHLHKPSLVEQATMVSRQTPIVPLVRTFLQCSRERPPLCV